MTVNDINELVQQWAVRYKEVMEIAGIAKLQEHLANNPLPKIDVEAIDSLRTVNKLLNGVMKEEIKRYQEVHRSIDELAKQHSETKIIFWDDENG